MFHKIPVYTERSQYAINPEQSLTWFQMILRIQLIQMIQIMIWTMIWTMIWVTSIIQFYNNRGTSLIILLSHKWMHVICDHCAASVSRCWALTYRRTKPHSFQFFDFDSRAPWLQFSAEAEQWTYRGQSSSTVAHSIWPQFPFWREDRLFHSIILNLT